MNSALRAAALLLLLLSFSCSDENPIFDSQQNQCYQLIESGAYEEAYRVASEMIEADNISHEQLSEAYYIMAWSARKTNMFSEAIVLYEHAIKYATDDDIKANRMKNLGTVFHYVNEFQGATDIYLEAAELSDKWAPVNYYNASISQVDAGDYAGAAESLEAGMKICNQDAWYMAMFYNQYGIIERDMYELSGEQQHAKLATQYFQYAMTDANPKEMYMAKHYLATLYIMQHDTVQAMNLLQEAVSQQSDKQQRFHAVMEYAKLLQQVGKLPKAISQVDTALALYPQITRAREEMKVFFLANRLGKDVLDYHEVEFEAYATELELAQQEFRAYIGRQIMEERRLREVKFWWIVGFCVMVAIAGGMLAIYQYKRLAIKSRIQRIKSTEII